nr:probable sulfate transporter 3.4 [Tanacetum cinerariifolium]
MGLNSNRVENYSGSGHARGTESMTSSLPLHSVCLPPQKSTLQKLRHRLSEVFFPDDPLHGFKNQTRFTKCVLALKFFFPIFEWAPNYTFELLRSDVVSGLTIASLAIPQGISYAKLANLPPIIGLYSSFVPPLIYSVLGSSRHLAVGPVSIASLVMGTMLNEAVPYAQDPVLYLKLAFTATFFAGVFQATLGLLREYPLRTNKGLAKVCLNNVFCLCFIDLKLTSLNPPSSNMLYFHGKYLGLAIKTGIITGILSLTEGIAVGRTFAALNDYQVDGNKEMIAIGLQNMAGSCSSCYVTTGSFSRSAVNANAGAKTVGAIRLWKVDKLDFLACLSSFFGVLMISVPIGLAIAVGVSVFKILLHVTRPNTGVLGNIPGTQIYQNLNRYREARRLPCFVILSVEAPIYFANSTYLQERILRWIREEEEWLAANNGAVTGIDTSGLGMVKELKKILEKRSLQLVLSNPGGIVMEKLHQSNILELFGLDGVYLTVDEAVADISSAWKA